MGEAYGVGSRVSFVLGTGRAAGVVVKRNANTVLVQLPNGQVVKRHLDKHKVALATGGRAT